MSTFHIVINEEPRGEDNLPPIERLSLRLDTLDLNHVVQVLTTPPKQRRKDAGIPRGTKKQEGLGL